MTWGNEETLTSAATEAMAPAPPPLTVSLRGAAPAAHDGSTEFTFEIEFSEEFPLSYRKLKLHAFDVTDGEVLKAKRVVKSSNISWRDYGAARLQRRCDRRAAGHHALRRPGGQLHQRRQETVQLSELHRLRTGAIGGRTCGHAEGVFAAPSQRGSPGSRSRRRRSWWATHTSGGPRRGRKQAR